MMHTIGLHHVFAPIGIICLPYLHHVFYEDKRITSTPRTDSHHWHAGATHQRQRYRAPHSAADRRTLYDPEPLCRVTVTGGGTGVGISALLDQTTDIAMASRAIKFSEKMKAKAAGEDLAEVPIAYDALAVVVHPSNPVKQLTRQQLEDIFRGKSPTGSKWAETTANRSLLPRDFLRYLRVFKESVLKTRTT